MSVIFSIKYHINLYYFMVFIDLYVNIILEKQIKWQILTYLFNACSCDPCGSCG
jgi:hypothetical protein